MQSPSRTRSAFRTPMSPNVSDVSSVRPATTPSGSAGPMSPFNVSVTEAPDRRRGPLVTSARRTAEIAQMGTFVTSDTVLFVVPLPKMNQVWTGEERGWIRVRDPTSGDVIHQHHFKQSRYVTAMVPSTSGSHVFVAHTDGAITVFDAERKIPTTEMLFHEAPITSLTVSSGRIVSGSADGRIAIWDDATFGCSATAKISERSITCIAIDPAQLTVFAGCGDGRVWLVSLGGNVIPEALDFNVAVRSLLTVDQHLLCGLDDGTIRIINIRSEAKTEVKRLADHKSPVTKLVCNEGEHKIWSSSKEGGVVVYDTISFDPIQFLSVSSSRGLRYGNEETTCVAGITSANVWRVWTCSSDGTVRQWLSQTLDAPQAPAAPPGGYNDAEVEGLRKKIQEQQEELERLRANDSAFLAAENVSLRSQVAELREKLATVTNLSVQSGGDANELQRRAAHLERDNTELTEQLRRQSADMNSLAAASEALRLELRAASQPSRETDLLRTELRAKAEELASMHTRVQHLNQEFDAAKRSKDDINAQLKLELDRTIERSQAPREELALVRSELEDSRREVAKLSSVLALRSNDSQQEISLLRQEASRKEETIRAQTHHLEELSSKEAEELQTLRRRVAELEHLRAETASELNFKVQELARSELQLRTLRNEVDDLSTRSVVPTNSTTFDPSIVLSLEGASRHAIGSLENHVRYSLMLYVNAAFTTMTNQERTLRRQREEMESLRVTIRNNDDELARLTGIDDAARAANNRLQDKDRQITALKEQIEDQDRVFRESIERKNREAQETTARLSAESDELLKKIREMEQTSSLKIAELINEHETTSREARAAAEKRDAENSSTIAGLQTEVKMEKDRVASLEDAQTASESRVKELLEKKRALETAQFDKDKEIARCKDEIEAMTTTGADQQRHAQTMIAMRANEVEALSKENANLKQSINKIETELKDVEESFTSTEAELKKLTRTVATLEARNTQLETQKDGVQARFDEHVSEAKASDDKLRAEIQTQSRALIEAKREAEEKGLELEKAAMKIQFLTQEVAALKGNVEQLIEQKSEAAQKLNGEVDEVSEQLRTTKKQLYDAQEALERQKREYDLRVMEVKETAVRDLATELRHKSENLITVENAKHAVAAKLAVCEEELKRLRDDVQTSKNDLQRLRDQNAALQKSNAADMEEGTKKQDSLAELVRKLEKQVQQLNRDKVEMVGDHESEITRLRMELSARTAQAAEMTEQKDKAEAEAKRQLSLVQSEMSQMDAEVSQLQRQVHEGSHFSERMIMQGEVAELRQSIQQMQRELTAKRQEIKELESSRLAFEADSSSRLVNEQATVIQLRNENERLQAQLKVKSGNITALEKQVADKDTNLRTSLGDQRTELEEQINTLRTDNANLQRDIKKVSADHISATRKIDEMQHEFKTTMRNERTQLEHTIDDYKTQVSQLQKELKNKSAELTILLKQIDDREQEHVMRIRNEKASVSGELEEAQLQLTQIQRELKNKSSEWMTIRVQLEDKVEELTNRSRTDKFSFEKQVQELEHELLTQKRELKTRTSENSNLRKLVDDNETDANTRYKNDILHLENQCALLRDQAAAQQRDIKAKTADIATLQRELDERDVDYTLKWKEERIVYEEEINRCKAEIATMKASLNTKSIESDEAEQLIAKLKATNVRIATEKAMAVSDADDQRETVERLKVGIKNLQIAGSDAEDRRRRDETELYEMRIKLENLSADLNDAKSRIAAQAREIGKHKENADLLQTIIDELRAQNRELTGETADASSLATMNLKKAQDNEVEADRWKDETRRLERELEGARISLDESGIALSQSEEQVRLLRINAQAFDLKHRDEVDTLKNRYDAQLKRERDSLYREVDSAGNSIQELNRQLTDAQRHMSQQEATIAELRRKIVGLERTLENTPQDPFDHGYIERQLTVVSQLLRKAEGNPPNLARANTALGDVLDYIHGVKSTGGN